MFKRINSRNFWEQEDRSKKERRNSFLSVLNSVSMLVVVFGLTIPQIVTIFWNKLPCVKIKKEEKIVEQLKVSQNYYYIEQILGKPMVKEDFHLPVRNKDEYIIGSKAIFCSELYTIITYFDDSETMFGYFLISHKNSFAPKMFRNMKTFNDKISNYVSGSFNGYLAMISSSYASRQDGSSHFMKYFTHHLGTNGCLVGVGISSLGFYKDRQTFFSLAGTEIEDFFFDRPIDYSKYEKRFELINECKINTFAMFIYDYTAIDVVELIKKETRMKLGLSHIEHSFLTE